MASENTLTSEREAAGEGSGELVRYLLAASSSISQRAIEENFVELSSGVLDSQVLVFDNCMGLVRTVRARWPNCETTAAPKGRSGFRSALRAVQRVVLYWDGDELTRLLFEARFAKIPTRLVPVQVTRVVNKKFTSDFDVYIGRGSPWGNPFAISREEDGPDRADVIQRYREYFHEKVASDKSFAQAVQGLRGLRLACFCKPDACHGDVIAEYLDGAK
jgi:hypothetical protein